MISFQSTSILLNILIRNTLNTEKLLKTHGDQSFIAGHAGLDSVMSKRCTIILLKLTAKSLLTTFVSIWLWIASMSLDILVNTAFYRYISNTNLTLHSSCMVSVTLFI